MGRQFWMTYSKARLIVLDLEAFLEWFRRFEWDTSLSCATVGLPPEEACSASGENRQASAGLDQIHVYKFPEKCRRKPQILRYFYLEKIGDTYILETLLRLKGLEMSPPQ